MAPAVVFAAQHYGTAVTTVGILIALCLVHWLLNPSKRVFFLYDTSISYVSQGDTIPAWAAVVAPLISIIISLVAYEFIIFRRCAVRLLRLSDYQAQGSSWLLMLRVPGFCLIL